MAELSLTKLPWKTQLAVFMVISLAGAGAFYYFYEMPQQEAIAAQQRELDGIRARINKGLTTARQLPEFRKEVDALQARLESLKPILPEEKDTGEILRLVQTLAVQSNLVIIGFKPQPVNTRELHAEFPISLELEGSYHNLGTFLDKVSKFPRIINVGKLELQSKQSPDANTSIEVSCTATTFVLIDPAARAGAAAKGAKKAA